METFLLCVSYDGSSSGFRTVPTRPTVSIHQFYLLQHTVSPQLARLPWVLLWIHCYLRKSVSFPLAPPPGQNGNFHTWHHNLVERLQWIAAQRKLSAGFPQPRPSRHICKYYLLSRETDSRSSLILEFWDIWWLIYWPITYSQINQTK